MLKKSLVLLGLSLSFVANAAVLDFEDVTTGNSSYLPENFAGFNWGYQQYGVIVDNDPDYSYQTTFGNSYGSPSGEYALYNGDGENKDVFFSESIDFHGAYFTTWAKNDAFGEGSSTSITIHGFNSGTLVHTISMDLSSTSYEWLQADFVGVDQLQFQTSGFEEWWLMDDFTYDINSSAVPIPAAAWLFGSALIGLAGIKRKN